MKCNFWLYGMCMYVRTLITKCYCTLSVCFTRRVSAKLSSQTGKFTLGVHFLSSVLQVTIKLSIQLQIQRSRVRFQALPDFLSSSGSGTPLWSSGQSLWLEIQRSRVRFPALPDFLSSSGSGTGSTQPREVN